MRFTSSVKGIRSLQEEYIENVNEFCNKDFSLLQKHEGDSKLFWKLLALCGVGKKMFHRSVDLIFELNFESLSQTVESVGESYE